ncbi:unnamed protein product [Adineta ricciae]|uniref:Amidase n=1 Tax=Adineta ricciae TaxID=249248 RepID=A0A815EGT5_ADIRI|nr:unnamed protein product [Adineta ricciae]
MSIQSCSTPVTMVRIKPSDRTTPKSYIQATVAILEDSSSGLVYLRIIDNQQILLSDELNHYKWMEESCSDAVVSIQSLLNTIIILHNPKDRQSKCIIDRLKTFFHKDHTELATNDLVKFIQEGHTEHAIHATKYLAQMHAQLQVNLVDRNENQITSTTEQSTTFQINLRIECHLNRTPMISTIYVHSGTNLQDLKEQIQTKTGIKCKDQFWYAFGQYIIPDEYKFGSSEPVIRCVSKQRSDNEITHPMTDHRRQTSTDVDIHLNKISLPYQSRKSTLSYGIWSTQMNMVEIVHQHRSLAKCLLSMGIRKNSKVYLYPEEAIYLMQSSLLHVSLSNFDRKPNFPLSLDEAYSLWFSQSMNKLNQLHVYQYLTRIGFILTRHQSAIAHRDEKEDVVTTTTGSTKRKREEMEDNEAIDIQPDHISICPIHSSSDCQRAWFPKYTDDPPILTKIHPRLVFPDELSPVSIDWLPPEYNLKVSQVQLSIYENKTPTSRPSYSLLRSIDLLSHSTMYQRLSSFAPQSSLPTPSLPSEIVYDMFTPRKNFRKTQSTTPDYHVQIKDGDSELKFEELYTQQKEAQILTAVVHNGDISFYTFKPFDPMIPIYVWPIGLLSSLFFWKWLQRSRYRSLSRNCAARKRLARDTRREELLHLLRTKYAAQLPEPKITEKIYKSTATELLDGLKRKEFTYTQVVLVLSLRSIKIGQEINCTTEEFFDQAIQMAETFDADTDDQSKLLLKGIPISIKDHIDQKGADSSMGMTTRNFQPLLKDGLIVQLLKEQGAIAGFVRTATIQGMMLPESESETYGVTTNPYNRTRTPGGSSGGDGALVAAHGAPIGIGSDIGGSIRIPAHFCGVFGYKPTPGRLTRKGVTVPSAKKYMGETNIRSTMGPLARCTDDLVLVMRSFLQETMWTEDTETPRQPWREERFNEQERLTIGYYTNDNWFSPAPACIRAVNEAADALRKLGHKVVPYTPIDIPEAVRLYVGLVGADGARHFLESLQNEPPNPFYSLLIFANKLPNFLRPLLAFILRLFGEQRSAHTLLASGPKSAYQYFDLVIDLRQYINRWLDEMKKNHIDLLLTPVNALPAYRRGQSSTLFSSCSYTFLFNVLHLPAGVVPMTVVRDDEQYYEDIRHSNNDMMVSIAKDVCRESAGLPIGVQLAGWPNDDERVLRVMKELENAIDRSQRPVPALANHIDIYAV